MYRTARPRWMKMRAHLPGDAVSRPLLPSTASEAWVTSIGQTGTRIAGYAFRSLRALAQVSLREMERRIGWEKRCTREEGMAALGKAVSKRECVGEEVAGRQWRGLATVAGQVMAMAAVLIGIYRGREGAGRRGFSWERTTALKRCSPSSKRIPRRSPHHRVRSEAICSKTRKRFPNHRRKGERQKSKTHPPLNRSRQRLST